MDTTTLAAFFLTRMEYSAMKRTATIRRVDRFDALADWVTPSDAMIFLQLSRSSLYEMVRDGSLPHRRFGRLIRIPKSALMPAVKEG